MRPIFVAKTVLVKCNSRCAMSLSPWRTSTREEDRCRSHQDLRGHPRYLLQRKHADHHPGGQGSRGRRPGGEKAAPPGRRGARPTSSAPTKLWSSRCALPRPGLNG